MDRSLVLPDTIISDRFGVAIDYDKIEQMIDGRAGFDLLWSMALRCSCRNNAQTDQPDPTCTVCHGTGVRYVHPRPENYPEYCEADGAVDDQGGVPIRGLFDDVSSSPGFQQQPGEWMSGRANVTVKGEIRLGNFDRLLMVDAELSFQQVLRRQAGSSIAIGRDADRKLRFRPVGIEALHTLTTRYRLRTDFNLEDGAFTWVTGRGPAVNELFSIRYTYHPTWIVVDYPRALAGSKQWAKHNELGHDEYKALPMQAKVALEFLV